MLAASLGQKQKALASLKKARQMCQEMGMDYFLARTEKGLEGLESAMILDVSPRRPSLL